MNRSSDAACFVQPSLEPRSATGSPISRVAQFLATLLCSWALHSVVRLQYFVDAASKGPPKADVEETHHTAVALAAPGPSTVSCRPSARRSSAFAVTRQTVVPLVCAAGLVLLPESW